MAHTKGLVISIKEEGMAQVATERKSACGGCQATQNCQSCLTNSKMVAEVLNDVGAKEGDLVDISLNSDVVLKGAAVLYLIPVAGLMGGALIGLGLKETLAISESAATIAFGFAGLCLGFLITAFISRWMSANNRLTPKISRIITRGTRLSPSLLFIDPGRKTKVCPE
jgi:sigma-E factor negative regulatory protein RseC